MCGKDRGKRLRLPGKQTEARAVMCGKDRGGRLRLPKKQRGRHDLRRPSALFTRPPIHSFFKKPCQPLLSHFTVPFALPVGLSGKNGKHNGEMFCGKTVILPLQINLQRMNPYLTTLLEILKYTIPALIVLISSYLIVKKFLVSQIQRKQLALFRESQDITLRLRLQAYERLVLFIERINPRQIIPRVYEPGMTVKDLQHALLYQINAEFEHNLSQQIYVSKQVWDTVKNVKEQELHMINQIAGQLKPDAPAKELHTRIVEYVLTVEGDMPTDVALQIIHDETRRLLHGGIAG
jgi:hypothetical protein